MTEIIENNIKKLQKNPQIDCFLYGKSYLGRNLYAFHKGSYNGNQLLITGGMHAREYISSLVVCKLCEEYDMSEGCYFLPFTNPDGTALCINGIESVSNEEMEKLLLRLNNYSTDFSLWKANARGVDLNVNFDAMWGESKFTKNLPSSSGFLGECACSEIENINLLDFIKDKNITMSLAYHSKGEVVYYGFEKLSKNALTKSKNIAKFLAKSLHYIAVKSVGSTGGLSDYLSYKLNIPSFTIELGSDNLSHPIGEIYLENIYKNQYFTLKNFIQKFLF